MAKIISNILEATSGYIGSIIVQKNGVIRITQPKKVKKSAIIKQSKQ